MLRPDKSLHTFVDVLKESAVYNPTKPEVTGKLDKVKEEVGAGVGDGVGAGVGNGVGAEGNKEKNRHRKVHIISGW